MQPQSQARRREEKVGGPGWPGNEAYWHIGVSLSASQPMVSPEKHDESRYTPITRGGHLP